MKTVRTLLVVTVYLLLILASITVLLSQKQERFASETQTRLQELRGEYARTMSLLTWRMDAYEQRFRYWSREDVDTCIRASKEVLDVVQSAIVTAQQIRSLATEGYRFEATLPFSDVSILRSYTGYLQDADVWLQALYSIRQSYRVIEDLCQWMPSPGTPT